jgi:hypothetical protein
MVTAASNSSSEHFLWLIVKETFLDEGESSSD